MKRTTVLDDGENIPVCIAVFKDPHGSFGFEAQQQRSHGATDLNSSPEILKASSFTEEAAINPSGEVSEAVCISRRGIQPVANEFSDAILSNPPGNTVVEDKGKMGADSKMERRKKTKRKKHRPKVIEVEKPESKPKMEIPMPPQTPNQKSPGKKKNKVIGRRTFARRKKLVKSLEEDEWEEAGDQPQASADDAINPSNNMQIDGDEFDSKIVVEPWESELVTEKFPEGSTNISTDVNIGIDQLLHELAKLPQKTFSPLFLKAELLQLNIECPVDTLKYIVDNIRIPSLLYFFNQAKRSMATTRSKGGHKLKEGLDHSSYEVLEEFLDVLKNLLPSILLKYDLSRSAGHLINNKQGRRSKRNISRSKEPRDMGKRTPISNAYSNCQIVPYTHLQELRSRFQHMEDSFPTPMTCNFTISRNIAQNWKHIKITPSQCRNNTMQLDFQDVVDNFRIVELNKDCELDVSAESRSAIVPSFGGGMIVPYNVSFRQPKQKLHRVEVLLDPETNRLWKLLQENEGDKVEDMDFCKLKWWENERRVFLGRAKSFIARMNLILGDRHFSPWKGSIVDSVVGVFLTQNVSDHLSSSAFMSLAAKFPLQRSGYEGGNSMRKPDECEETSTVSMTSLNDLPNLSNCDDQDLMEIQLNGHPLENLASQSYNLQNSLGSTRMESSERAMAIDGDGYVEHVANIPNAFGENAQNECRGLPRLVSEPLSCSNLNTHSVEMDAEMEATNSYSNETKASIMLENFLLRETKENVVDEGKIDWEGMRRKVYHDGDKKERSCESLDSVNWEAVRNADVKQISEAIRERGMNNLLAERIKDFLNRLVRDHGSIDLEWLRNVCPDDAKKYLLNIRGLGLKSVECVRLLALQNVAFPVDTNVARISVRLGWVPLKPLPEFLQLHLLEQYPILDSVQKYIWPRLCKLDQNELYELHYHMITFGKVFCTKSRPNCSICPMRGECKHFNSAKLALPASENKQFKSSSFSDAPLSSCISFSPTLPLQYDENHVSGMLDDSFDPIIEYPTTPIIEEPPASPPHEIVQIIEDPLPSPPHQTIQILDTDIEDAFYEDDQIPKRKLNLEQFGKSLQNLIQESDMKIHDNDVSKALIQLSAEAASIPVQKLKNISGLRTEHYVYAPMYLLYIFALFKSWLPSINILLFHLCLSSTHLVRYELPDSHILVKEMDQRLPDDPSPYLLAIWTPGETAQSLVPPESCCKTQEIGGLCEIETCFACNNIRELEAQTVRGTLLIPCRTAMRGSFPLNGTYFQINEVFADHDSSRFPIHIPRSWLWNLRRRTVYFGSSVATIFRGFMATEPIQYCFSRGFVCVRGFDRLTREPKPLYARLHLPKSKAPNNKKSWARQEE